MIWCSPGRHRTIKEKEKRRRFYFTTDAGGTFTKFKDEENVYILKQYLNVLTSNPAPAERTCGNNNRNTKQQCSAAAANPCDFRTNKIGRKE
jgi:hypothetical protein